MHKPSRFQVALGKRFANPAIIVSMAALLLLCAGLVRWSRKVPASPPPRELPAQTKETLRAKSRGLAIQADILFTQAALHSKLLAERDSKDLDEAEVVEFTDAVARSAREFVGRFDGEVLETSARGGLEEGTVRAYLSAQLRDSARQNDLIPPLPLPGLCAPWGGGVLLPRIASPV